jgi:hypothetical protein
VLLEAVRMFLKSVRVHLKSHKSTCRGSYNACIARESASKGLETVAEA